MSACLAPPGHFLGLLSQTKARSHKEWVAAGLSWHLAKSIKWEVFSPLALHFFSRNLASPAKAHVVSSGNAIKLSCCKVDLDKVRSRGKLIVPAWHCPFVPSVLSKTQQANLFPTPTPIKTSTKKPVRTRVCQATVFRNIYKPKILGVKV